MNIRSQKGFAGADVTVAVLIVLIFSAIIVTLYQNYVSTAKQIERKAEATQYAVETMEKIKQNSSDFFTEENAPLERQTIVENQPIDNTGYSKTVFLEDYSILGLREDAVPGYVKKVNVIIEYKIGKNTESVELNTIISKQEVSGRKVLKPGDIASKTQKNNYEDSNKDKSTIPEGFKISKEDNEINTGLVVEAPDGSEFVWVPVEKAVAGNETVGGTTKSMAVKDPDNTNYRGILYNFSGTSSSVMEGCTTSNFTNNLYYHEPSYLTDSSNGDASSYNNGRVTEKGLKSEYKAMIESVERYGGFYIGRYETSLLNKKPQSKKNQVPMDSTEESANTWWGMYEIQKNYANANGISSTVGSSMIWGSQYDATLNWILKGNDASKVTKNTTLRPKTTTGNTPEDVMNKIYDLGSNLCEWTLESFNTDARVGRGSYYEFTVTASNRYANHPYSTFGQGGSRITLHIM